MTRQLTIAAHLVREHWREALRIAAPILIIAGLVWGAAFVQHERNQSGVLSTLWRSE